MTVGGVLLLGGVPFGALLVWAISLVIPPRSVDLLTAFVTFAVLGGIEMFCVGVGYRLFFNRPNLYGSIFGPFGWMALGIVLTILTVSVAVGSVMRGWEAVLQATGPLIAMVIFALWCFRMHGRLKIRASENHAL
jgi:hypothetical protein